MRAAYAKTNHDARLCKIKWPRTSKDILHKLEARIAINPCI